MRTNFKMLYDDVSFLKLLEVCQASSDIELPCAPLILGSLNSFIIDRFFQNPEETSTKMLPRNCLASQLGEVVL